MPRIQKRAFTLIELLVVIAIIAILAAILFPVFAQAKVAAKKTSDLASVKQTNLSHMMYEGDSDDMAAGQNNHPVWGWPRPWPAGVNQPLGFMQPPRVPQIGDGNPDADNDFNTARDNMKENWARSIQPYMKSLQMMVSIAAPKEPANYDWGYKTAPGAGNATWFMNGAIQHKSATSISAPAELVVFQSAITTTCESRVQPVRDDAFDWNSGRSGQQIHSIDVPFAGNTFGKGANYGWADGHASYKLRSAMNYHMMGASGTVIVHGNCPGAGRDRPNTQGLQSDFVTKPECMDWTNTAISDLSAL